MKAVINDNENMFKNVETLNVSGIFNSREETYHSTFFGCSSLGDVHICEINKKDSKKIYD